MKLPTYTPPPGPEVDEQILFESPRETLARFIATITHIGKLAGVLPK